MVCLVQGEEKEAQDDSTDCTYQKLLHGKEATKNNMITKNSEDVGPGDVAWAWKWRQEEKLFLVQNQEYDLGKGYTVFSARIVPIHALSGTQMTYNTSSLCDGHNPGQKIDYFICEVFTYEYLLGCNVETILLSMLWLFPCKTWGTEVCLVGKSLHLLLKLLLCLWK